jgi:3',5'-cyclic AMP phosphodiesterase CpdA
LKAVKICLCLLLLASVVEASTPQLYDYNYLSRPTKPQAEPPLNRLNPIIVPTGSSPALVGWNEKFEVYILLPPGVFIGQTTSWLVALTTRMRGEKGEFVGQPVDVRISLPIEEVRTTTEGNIAVLTVSIPAFAAREIYHLDLAGPGGVRGRRPYAVRVLGDNPADKSFNFVVLADSQLTDPSAKFSGGDKNTEEYPKQGENDAESVFIQQIQEISFLDPDFVLFLGDLVFGLDYRKEYPHILSKWWELPLASYMIPGNHDGMALYEIALREGWWLEALGSIRCAKYVVDQQVTAEAVFETLACLLGDLKKILFEDLTQDGLDYWRRILGPTDYSFDFGPFHFVGINSYAGSPERRHAFVLGLGFIGVDFGAATVDNYGGTLTSEQLAWLENDLTQARMRKKTNILFIHHDPRGNRDQGWTRRYHANLPFPTEPLGLRKFQEWNFDSEKWSSDPKKPLVETQVKNSATALLRLIAKYVPYVFTGHLHADSDEVIDPGQELVPGLGIRVSQKTHFARVTTASSTPENSDEYWGYRWIKTAGNSLENIIFHPRLGWHSLPAGNFWIIGSGVPIQKEGFLYVINSRMPTEIEGSLRAYLKDVPEGYRFSAQGTRVELRDINIGEQAFNVYYLKVLVPAGKADQRHPAQKVHLTYKRATGNHTPIVDFEYFEQASPNQKVKFDGSLTKDPDNSKLIQYIWDFGDGHTARGKIVEHAYDSLGNYSVSLMVIDDCGARARMTQVIEIVPVPSCCAFEGVGCGAAFTIFVLLGLVFIAWRIRRIKLDT